jgi:hypothetical protein
MQQNPEQFDPIILTEFIQTMRRIEHRDVGIESFELSSILSIEKFAKAATQAI